MHETFEHYQNVLATARNRANGKPLANNTRVYDTAYGVGIMLHSTCVVEIAEDGRVKLNSGGWRTVTTKDRMNNYSPCRISSVKGTWYVAHEKARQQAERQTRREFGIPLAGNLWQVTPDDFEYRTFYRRVDELCDVPYFDGIEFDAEGNCLNGIDPETWNRYQAMKAEREKMIQRYCTGFFQALKKGMQAPSGGDCWYCSMRTQNGLTMGDDSGSTNHLLAHIEERYYVPSLVWNALKEAGYRDVGILVLLGYKPDTGQIGGEAWAGRQTGMGGGTVRRDLRNYLIRRLIPDPPSPDNGWRFDGETLPLIAVHRAERTAVYE